MRYIINKTYNDMPEYTELQLKVLQILEDNSKKDLFSKTCNLKNPEIYNKLKPSVRPFALNYISEVLKALETKNRIKIAVKYEIGCKGRKRTITIL